MIRVCAPLLFLAGPAFAGCGDYTDGSLATAPLAYEICYGATCDIVLVEWECANIHGHQTQWTGGWARSCKPDLPCEWTWMGRPIRPDRAANIQASIFSRTPN